MAGQLDNMKHEMNNTSLNIEYGTIFVFYFIFNDYGLIGRTPCAIYSIFILFQWVFCVSPTIMIIYLKCIYVCVCVSVWPLVTHWISHQQLKTTKKKRKKKMFHTRKALFIVQHITFIQHIKHIHVRKHKWSTTLTINGMLLLIII